MFFPNRRMALGYLALLLPPLVITLLAFATLARLDEADMVVGVPLDAALDPTPDPLAEALTFFQEGVAQQEAGNYAAAEAAYRSALAVDPALAPVFNALGSLYVTWQRPSEAIPMYQQATQLGPETAEFWRNLGIVQANQGQTEAGIAALETAVALTPNDPLLHLELGQVYAYEQRSELAREAFNRVLALSSNPALTTAADEQLRLLPPP
jgi:tetratricopeptide (TPR) repeat protein